jgi:mercuric ion transport protein
MQDSANLKGLRTMALSETSPLPTIAKEPRPVPQVAPDYLAALAMAVGFGAVAASSSCVIPLILGSLGAGAGLFSGLEVLSQWRPLFFGVSALAVAGAWAMWWRQRRTACSLGSACATPRRSRTLALLAVSTLIVVTAGGWNQFEPSILKLMRLN